MTPAATKESNHPLARLKSLSPMYGLSSAELREWLRSRPIMVVLAGCVLVAVLLWYLPTLEWRLTYRGHFRWSGRDVLWQRYFADFLSSPAFGRGLGARHDRQTAAQ